MQDVLAPFRDNVDGHNRNVTEHRIQMSPQEISEPPRGPNVTSFELITLDKLESPAVIAGNTYWQNLRGTRRFPARQDMHPRDFASLLRDMLLVQVIDSGADFKFRITGDAHVQAYAIPFQGRRLNEFVEMAPAFCFSLRSVFAHVAQTGSPAALRGRMGTDFPNANYAYCENIFLPLGVKDTVDHILGFSTYLSRDFEKNEL